MKLHRQATTDVLILVCDRKVLVFVAAVVDTTYAGIANHTAGDVVVATSVILRFLLLVHAGCYVLRLPRGDPRGVVTATGTVLENLFLLRVMSGTNFLLAGAWPVIVCRHHTLNQIMESPTLNG